MTDQAILADFYRTIWREEKGYVYLAFKHATSGLWTQRFYEWPAEEHLVITDTVNERTSQEVYFAPSLFRDRSSRKENVIGSFCYWIEFDGKLPVDFGEVPAPTMVVQTSTETHQHIYWCTDSLQEVDRIEAVNHSLTYKLGADTSGWDANQVLRPPQTLNHKKQLQAKLVSKTSNYLSSVAFSELTIINLPPKIEIEGPLPPIADTVRKYAWSNQVWSLFIKGNGQDRSVALMYLGYYLAEMNLTNPEMMTLLLDADKRWGKFSGRNDQLQRLNEIITRARLKYPFKIEMDKDESRVTSIGDGELLATQIEVEWLWDGLLHQTGYLLLTGHTGVGKSQFSLDFATHLVLGKDFLGRKIAAPKKVAFVSLEMDQVEVKYIREHQKQSLTEEEYKTISTGLRYVIVGESVYFNRADNQMHFEEFIEREKIECIIFDSLGSMTEEELSKEGDSKALMDWIAHLRKMYGMAVVIIHHHRKGQAGNKRPNTISDIYGSHYFTARATTVMTLWDPTFSGLIEVSLQKLRMAKKGKPWAVKRNDTLTFETSSKQIIIVDDTVAEEAETPVGSEVDVTENVTEEFKF